VPDFAAIVRERLRLASVDERRAAEIHAEMTAHLEEIYTSAIAEGHSRDDAARLAFEEVTDWPQLARDVTSASTEDGMMSHQMRTLWLPGLTMVGCAAAVLLGIGWLTPGEWWANRSDGSQYVAAFGAVLLYVLLGAVGAGWSRRVGGTWRERLGAALLPAALHLTMTIGAILAGIIVESQRHPTHALNPQLRAVFVFVVVPAMALSLGAAPFLRQKSRASNA
jgi:hypothetical protein